MVLEVKALKSGLVKEKDDIVGIIKKSLKKAGLTLKEKDVLVVASKVLAVSQGRVCESGNDDYKKGSLKKIIKQESDRMFKTECCWLSYKDGHLVPNAGVDKSNAPKMKVVLWPKNPFKEAKRIRSELKKHYKLKKLGVIISDSTCAPLRQGVYGISIGHAGFEGVHDCRNKKDIYGKKLNITQRAMSDGLAAAALLVMGEADEKKPFVLIRGADIKFSNKSMKHLPVPVESDLFCGIYKNSFKRFIKN